VGLVEFDGSSTAFDKMKKILDFLFGGISFDYYVEGKYAHEYSEDAIRKEIKENYNKKYNPTPDPFSHPENYDPLNPPTGWAYDPYYEFWIKIDE
jgi:hypothetical protein